jgi:hypothetical protein
VAINGARADVAAKTALCVHETARVDIAVWLSSSKGLPAESGALGCGKSQRPMTDVLRVPGLNVTAVEGCRLGGEAAVAAVQDERRSDAQRSAAAFHGGGIFEAISSIR